MFITAGLSTMFVFFAIDFSDKTTTMPPQLFWFAFGGYVYIQGAVLYVLRVPERCKPGAFDLCGASHQIFHVAVLCGSAIHFWQNYQLFQMRQTFECPIN